MNWFITIALVTVTLIEAVSQSTYERTAGLMGGRFDITVVADDSIQGAYFIDLAIEEIIRIERLISSWDQASQTSEINLNAGTKTVPVDLELFKLIERSIGISTLTDGAFDISYASMDKIWKFDGTMTKMPSEDQVAASVEKVGYKNIVLDHDASTVFLKLPGMKIGFGAIGKGYAADQARDLLVEHRVPGGIINASGDIAAWGKQVDGSDWTVAITNPMNTENAFAWFPITDGAVVTSGDYERYVNFNGKRFTHIIDPRTGYPSTGIISVTVFAPKAELADALATSIFVMGKEVGLDRIDQLPGIECIIIDEAGAVHMSQNLQVSQYDNK